MEEEDQEPRKAESLEAGDESQVTAIKKTGTIVLGHRELNSAHNPNKQGKHSLVGLSERNAAEAILIFSWWDCTGLLTHRTER